MANVGVDSFLYQLALEAISKGKFAQVGQYNALMNVIDPAKSQLVGYNTRQEFVSELMAIVTYLRNSIQENPLIKSCLLVSLTNEPTLLADPNLIYIDVVIQ